MIFFIESMKNEHESMFDSYRCNEQILLVFNSGIVVVEDDVVNSIVTISNKGTIFSRIRVINF